MAKLIKTNGEKVEVSPANGKDFTLDELQGFVDGYFELVNIPKDRYMVVNEDGVGQKPNIGATEFAWSVGQLNKFANNIVRGDVLVCDVNQIQ